MVSGAACPYSVSAESSDAQNEYWSLSGPAAAPALISGAMYSFVPTRYPAGTVGSPAS